MADLSLLWLWTHNIDCRCVDRVIASISDSRHAFSDVSVDSHVHVLLHLLVLCGVDGSVGGARGPLV